MGDGSLKYSKKIDELIQKLTLAGMVTRTIGLLTIAFLLLSIYIPSLLSIVGSLIVALTAMFSFDLHRNELLIADHIEKAQAVNEFQMALKSVIDELKGLRYHYDKRFDPNGDEHTKHERFLKVPYMPVIPKIDTKELKKSIAKLSFAAGLMSKDDIEGIEQKDISFRARSLTHLSFQLSAIEALVQMWIVRNQLYLECYTVTDKEDPAVLKPDFSGMPEIQKFDNYVALTDECMRLTDTSLEFCKYALELFIPAAAGLLNDEAKSRCPIPIMRGDIFNPPFLFKDLEGDEAKKSDDLARNIAQDNFK